MIKIATSTWSFHPELISGKLTIEELITFCAENGIEGIEIVDIDLIDPSLENLMRIKELANDKGIEISCLSLEHDLCRLSKEARESDVRKVINWIEHANALDVKLVRVFTGWSKSGYSYEEQKEWVYQGLKELVIKAEENNIDLVLENHNDICESADEIIELIKEINSPRLFTCPDPYNFASSGTGTEPIVSDQVYEEFNKMLPYAKNVHIKFTKYKESGEDAYMDSKRLLSLMERNHYSGFWTIEFCWPNREDNFNFLEEVRKGAELLRSTLGVN